MIDRATRVCLARHVRMRDDPRTGRPMLLSPERGLELNATGARIAILCREPRTVGEIIDRLVLDSDGATPQQIQGEVLAFLGALEDRALLVVGAP